MFQVGIFACVSALGVDAHHDHDVVLDRGFQELGSSIYHGRHNVIYAESLIGLSLTEYPRDFQNFVPTADHKSIVQRRGGTGGASCSAGG